MTSAIDGQLVKHPYFSEIKVFGGPKGCINFLRMKLATVVAENSMAVTAIGQPVEYSTAMIIPILRYGGTGFVFWQPLQPFT